MKEEIEIWKEIKGFKGFYLISNKGRVKSTKREVLRYDGRKNYIKERILKPKKAGAGYLQVTLSNNSLNNYAYIHRLVAEYFVEKAENKTDVNHISGIKKDNTASNLEWCTKSENSIHSYTNKLNIPPV